MEWIQLAQNRDRDRLLWYINTFCGQTVEFLCIITFLV
jgi:hypothetical protein